MKLAFCLIRYSVFGGMQRDALRIAQACLAKGHEVEFLVAEWEGETPEGCSVKILSSESKGNQSSFFGKIVSILQRGAHALRSNHGRYRDYVRRLSAYLNEYKFDRVIGFNKLPGLDFYYAADGCYEARARQRLFLYRFLPRYRWLSQCEKAVFEPSTPLNDRLSPTIPLIFTLTQDQQRTYQQYYKTPDERFCLLSPQVDVKRLHGEGVDKSAKKLRKSLNIPENDIVLLMIGSHFDTKGVDRSIRALASLPKNLSQHVHLWIVGEGKQRNYQRLARRQGLTVATQEVLAPLPSSVVFFGGQETIGTFLHAANILVHPARTENTGLVLIESLVAGVPVIASGVCGYATHITRAHAGIVLPEPFEQKSLNKALFEALDKERYKTWKPNAIQYAKVLVESNMVEEVVDAFFHSVSRS